MSNRCTVIDLPPVVPRSFRETLRLKVIGFGMGKCVGRRVPRWGRADGERGGGDEDLGHVVDLEVVEMHDGEGWRWRGIGVGDLDQSSAGGVDRQQVKDLLIVLDLEVFLAGGDVGIRRRSGSTTAASSSPAISISGPMPTTSPWTSPGPASPPTTASSRRSIRSSGQNA